MQALETLRNQGYTLCILAQNIVEFRVVATRPVSVNGLGMSQQEVDLEIERLKFLYRVFPDTSEIFEEWSQLVKLYGAEGKQNHDARIAAAMNAHKISAILTFNKSDFIRYPNLSVWEPKDLLNASPL